ncbi:M15 family metallopeptidase [Microbacterium sp. SLBN-146]|uniref:M15 family metallopeptidase n=1 Tax=Microbacterium sp. SLBN-146 TaxID=2768457 RepID=UPI001153A85E|nr:M15 family metallopeptidase [Microbacterium sp. SLBN-146]TQJ29999.1 D-alanyl-D-alanine carboxypeptidase-like protein [Microbacterium sp. SLBN-146]
MKRTTRLIGSVISATLLLSAAGCATFGEPGGSEIPRNEQTHDGPIGPADGFHRDEALDPWADVPAITRLEPALRTALQSAAAAARAAGTDFWVTSGWRSARYQQHLLDEAIVTYRSEAEAMKLVQTPEKSKHVTGEAVDVGPTDANSWMSIHGAEYGLCQVYANEMWHFELLTEPGGTCPRARADAAS